MPRGPKGEKRTADTVQNAILVARIATGEIDDSPPPNGDKDPAAVALGRKGGEARAKAMSPRRRTQIAKKAANKRWEKP
jgi:hypothetical protein